MTHRWLKRCINHLEKTPLKYDYNQTLFPIVQGSTYKDLRKQSAEFIASVEAEGNAIGGLSVGEPAEELYAMSEIVCEILPEDKPRYLMGVGTPINILENIGSEEQKAKWDAAYGPKNEALRKANLTGKELVKWKYQRYMKNYLRCIKTVDDSVGQLMGYLKDAGLSDNTIVIYSSDQGFYLGDHGWYDKRWMYEESLKMPFIAKWPGKTKPGSINTDMIQNLDYAETFLDAAGVDVPEDMQGRSLVPLLKGETPSDWRKSLYYHYYEYPSVHMVPRHNGVRGERFKLMHFYQFDEWEFYDLEKDPDELSNEYNNPAYSNEIASMKEELKRLIAHYEDDSDMAVKPQEWQEQYRIE